LFPDKIYEFLYLKIWQRIYWKKKIKFENEAMVIWDDDSRSHKLSFMTFCNKNDIDYPKKMTEIYERLRNN
jgi:hypothetical protein